MEPIPDPEKLRLTPRQGAPEGRYQSQAPRHRNGDKFLKGPIPWSWLTLAARQPGKALHVAIALWFWAGVKRRRQMPLSLSRLTMLGADRFSAARGLAALEQAGLVSVIRLPGRNPTVTLLEPQELPENGQAAPGFERQPEDTPTEAI